MAGRLLPVLATLLVLTAASLGARANEALLAIDVTGDYAERCLEPGFGSFDCEERQRYWLQNASGDLLRQWSLAEIPPLWHVDMLSIEPGGPAPRVASSQVRVRYFQPGVRIEPVGPGNGIVASDHVLYEATGTLDWRIQSGAPMGLWRIGAVSPLAVIERSVGFGLVPAYAFGTFVLTPHDGTVTLGILEPAESGGPPYYQQLNPTGPTRFNQMVRIGLPPGFRVRGPIEGTLVSSVPTQTPTPNEVHEATLSLYAQTGGRARAQQPGESDGAYEDYLLGLRGPLFGRLTLRVDERGLSLLDFPGAFRFAEVPAYDQAPAGSGRLVTEQLYFLIVVEDAATEEDSLDVPGQKETLSFLPHVEANLVPGGPPRTIALDPITGIAQKRRIAQTLIDLCDQNYGPVEGQVLVYLAQLEASPGAYTRELEEGVLRAVWAERSARIGLQFGDELMELFLRGLGTLVADLFGDVVEFQTASLRRARARLEKWKGAGGADRFATGLDPASLGDQGRVRKLLESDRKLAGNAGDARTILELVKGAKASIRWSAAQAAASAGLPPERGEQVAGALVFALQSLASAVASAGNLTNGAFPGGLKPALKLAIDQSIQALRPALVDGVSPSYCAYTQSSLAYVRDRMQGWAADDRADFAADRARLAGDLNARGRRLGDHIAGIYADLEIGSALDQAGDTFDALGNFDPKFKAAAVGSKAAKYLFNASGTIGAGVIGLLDVPADVERWSRLAFGDPPPAPGLAASAASVRSPATTRGPTALGNAASDVTALRQALDALRGEVASDAVAAALARAGDGSATGLPERLASWGEDVTLFTGLVGAQPAATAGNGAFQTARDDFERARADLLVVQTATASLLAEWTSGVLVDWSGPGDLAYRQARSRLVGALAVTSAKIGVLAQRIAALDALLAAPPLPLLAISSLTVVSQATGDEVISASPETFTVTARIRNLSDQGVSGPTARLTVGPAAAPVVITGGSDRAVAALAADDGVPGSGPDEATVSWTFTWSGTPEPSALVVAVDLLEGSSPPTSFGADGALATVLVEPSLYDSDLDGLPDDYELAAGTDPNVDDAALDRDGDGLSNAHERALGTDPDDPDSDGDGRSDRLERDTASSDQVTDPLNPDSDGDGTPDGSDGAPNDASTITAGPGLPEPRVAVDRSRLVLDGPNAVGTIEVTNGGAGELAWTVWPDDPALIAVSPAPGERQFGPRALYVTARDGFDFATLPSVTTTLTLFDVSGGTPDVRKVEVVLQAVPEPGTACGGAAATAVLMLCRALRRRARGGGGGFAARLAGRRIQVRADCDRGQGVFRGALDARSPPGALRLSGGHLR